MIKLRSSTKVVASFFAIVVGGWFAYNKIEDVMIMGQTFPPIVPGRINIIAVNPANYRIIIANQVAKLVQTQGGFNANESDDEADENSTIKKIVSIKDMLAILQGDSEALGEFVMSMNDMSENELPPVRVTWTKDQIQKALAGDAVLSKKLVSDLNIQLDGMPLSGVRPPSIENGIVVEIPVTLDVPMNGKLTPVTGKVLEAFKPIIVKAVNTLVADKSNVDNAMIAGYYEQEAEKVLQGKSPKENIRKELQELIDSDAADKLTETPKQLLSTATVLVNDSMMADASYQAQSTATRHPYYQLKIDLNDEGRRRLWKYSRQRVGAQLLLTSDGVAIAAARIAHPLSGGEITIDNLGDPTLLQDFDQTLKETKQKVAQK